MASIFTTNMNTRTVQASGTTGAAREVVEDKSSNITVVSSSDTTPTIVMHDADRKTLKNYGVTD